MKEFLFTGFQVICVMAVLFVVSLPVMNTWVAYSYTSDLWQDFSHHVSTGDHEGTTILEDITKRRTERLQSIGVCHKGGWHEQTWYIDFVTDELVEVNPSEPKSTIVYYWCFLE